MNILDVAQNSVSAGAKNIDISVIYSGSDDLLTIIINDNGKGMDNKMLANVTDPFFTTRTTRNVGLGIPFFKMAAEMTGGSFEIDSVLGEGTSIKAIFSHSHIDRASMGDLAETMGQLICLNEEIQICFTYDIDGAVFKVSTSEFTTVLEGVPLNSPQIMQFVCSYIRDNMNSVSDVIL